MTAPRMSWERTQATSIPQGHAMGNQMRGVRPIQQAGVRRFRNDDGIAMFSVLMVGAIATVLVGTAFAAASSTLRRADRAETREQALHLAEAGAARATTAMRATPSYSTTTDSYTGTASREWILSHAASGPLESAREGQYSWVVPAGSSEIFSVGYVPSRAAPRELRILQLEVDAANPFGDLSFLSAGSANMNGNVDISVGGSAHSNVDLTMIGSATITGNATSTGTFSKTSGVVVTGVSGGGYLPYDIPAIDALDHRHLTSTDLCPDGTVRATTPSMPCTGTVIGSGILGWNGWTWSASEWNIAGNTAGEGGFFVYHSSVRISGNVSLWRGTVVIKGLRVSGNLVNGDFTMTGATDVTPAAGGIAVVAERDLVASGNGRLNGLVLAGEQVSLGGNIEVRGQLISGSEVSSPGSPVSQSSLSGNVSLVAQVHAPSQEGGFAATSWVER